MKIVSVKKIMRAGKVASKLWVEDFCKATIENAEPFLELTDVSYDLETGNEGSCTPIVCAKMGLNKGNTAFTRHFQFSIPESVIKRGIVAMAAFIVGVASEGDEN